MQQILEGILFFTRVIRNAGATIRSSSIWKIRIFRMGHGIDLIDVEPISTHVEFEFDDEKDS